MKAPVTKRQIAAAHNFYSQGFGKGPVAIPAKRAKSRDLEHKEQQALCQWWRFECKRYGLPEFALFAVPSGGHRHLLTAVRLKAEGVRKGIPDMMLAVVKSPYAGLFLENKSKDGSVSTDQVTVAGYLETAGYQVQFSYSAAEAMMYIRDYLRE